VQEFRWDDDCAGPAGDCTPCRTRKVSGEVKKGKGVQLTISVQTERLDAVPSDISVPTDMTFFYGSGSENHEIRTGFFVCKGIISTISKAEFGNDRVCVLKVHAPTVDKLLI
jgi:hypothetical protein